jgi:hypothetical protein
MSEEKNLGTKIIKVIIELIYVTVCAGEVAIYASVWVREARRRARNKICFFVFFFEGERVMN